MRKNRIFCIFRETENLENYKCPYRRKMNCENYCEYQSPECYIIEKIKKAREREENKTL